MGFVHKVATALDMLQGFAGTNALPHSRATLFWTWLRLRLKAKLAPASRSHAVLHYRVETDDPGALAFLFFEVFAVQEYAFHSTHDRPLIFDVGANIGMATLFFKTLFPHAAIHAFEPSPRTFELLTTNIRANNLSNVTLHNLALSDHDGEIEFFTDPTKGASMIASTRPERSVQWADPALADKGKVRVKAARLSTFINREVDFLKMDIEGAEQQVLEDLASSGTLRRIRSMVIEYHHHIAPNDDALAQFLRLLEVHGFGYQLRAPLRDLTARDEFQDMLILAYRRDRHGA
jgi:FkbM family methyltransferase